MTATGYIVKQGEPGYPEALHDLSSPPDEIRVRGEVPLAAPTVAIVGARSADRWGVKFAHRLASDLVAAGVVVISGGALGIDSAAHLGALDGGGRTLLILACGLETDYPKGTGALRARIAESGAVISAFPDDAKPLRGHFYKRNRMMAALSQAVVVVQAGARSGALVTAELAQRLDRQVMAVPGVADAALTRGTHGLLRNGALMAENAKDVLTAIGRESKNCPAVELSSVSPRLEGVGAEVFDWLDSGPASVDELARGLGRPVSEVLATLTDLELRGLVISHAGCYERR